MTTRSVVKLEPLRLTGRECQARRRRGRGRRGKERAGSRENLDGADAGIAENGDELDGDLAVSDVDRDGGVDGLEEGAGAGEDVEIGEDRLSVDEDVEEALAGLGEGIFVELEIDGAAAVGDGEQVGEGSAGEGAEVGRLVEGRGGGSGDGLGLEAVPPPVKLESGFQTMPAGSV